MKKVIIGIVSSLLLLIIAGAVYWQNKVNRPYKPLLHADTLMLERPDSALQVLKSIADPQNLYGENQALYALLMTQARYKNYLPVENDSLIRFAVDYYAEGKDSLRKAWSCFYMARVCENMNDKKRSLIYYQKAATAAEGCDNYKLLDLLHYYWGILLQPEKPYEEGLNKLMKAKEYEELNKDTISLINTLAEIAWGYLWEEEYKSAQDNLLQAIQLASLTKQDDVSWLYYRLSVLYWITKEYPKALEYIDYSLCIAKDTNALMDGYFHKGSIFNKLHRYDSARYYIEKGKIKTDFYANADYHNEMSALEKSLGNYEKALTHHEIYSQYIDSIQIKKDNERVMDLEKRYNYTTVQNENMALKAKTQRQRILVLIIALFSLIILFISYYIYNRIKKNKEDIIRSKDDLLNESLKQLQQKTKELMLHREAIREKENELRAYTQKEQGLKENILSKDEKLRQYAQQQQELKEQIFKMNEAVKKIEELNSLNSFQKKKAKAELALSDQEISSLFSAINLCYDNFEKRLRAEFPKLTNENIYICCLVKMKISNQNMMILLASSEEALRKCKYRIKHDKLNITQEGISLDDFLSHY